MNSNIWNVNVKIYIILDRVPCKEIHVKLGSGSKEHNFSKRAKNDDLSEESELVHNFERGIEDKENVETTVEPTIKITCQKTLEDDPYDPPCIVDGSDKDNHDEDSPTLILTEKSKVLKPVTTKSRRDRSRKANFSWCEPGKLFTSLSRFFVFFFQRLYRFLTD